MTKDTFIAFKDTKQVNDLLKQVAGPFGTKSKVIRQFVREGLERRGLAVDGQQARRQAA